MMAILLVMVLAAPCAPKKPCPPTCSHKPKSCLLANLKSGFDFTAGFRWAPEHDCPTLLVPKPEPRVRDPFFIGAGVTLPLTERTSMFGAFNRDFTDAPHWSVTAGLHFRPFQ